MLVRPFGDSLGGLQGLIGAYVGPTWGLHGGPKGVLEAIFSGMFGFASIIKALKGALREQPSISQSWSTVYSYKFGGVLVITQAKSYLIHPPYSKSILAKRSTCKTIVLKLMVEEQEKQEKLVRQILPTPYKWPPTICEDSRVP